MTKQEEKKVIEIYGPNYEETDIPTFIRNRTEAKLAKIQGQEEIKIWEEDRGWITIKKSV